MENCAVKFYPFYEKLGPNRVMGLPAKIIIALALGGFYLIALLASLEDHNAFYTNRSWALGAIISFSLLALYAATATFRNLLPLVCQVEKNVFNCQATVDRWLSNINFIVFALMFAILNTVVGYIFGIPVAFAQNPVSEFLLYTGFFLTGLTCGMAVGGIVGVAMFFDGFSANLKEALDYHEFDGRGGTQVFGNALILFCIVTLFVGVLISVYLTGVEWAKLGTEDDRWVRFIIYFWIAFPYALASAVLLIPWLAVSTQVSAYKQEQAFRLKKEIAETKKEIRKSDGSNSDTERLIKELTELQDDLLKVYEMKIHPVNRDGLVNFFVGLVPSIIGTVTAVTSAAGKFV